MVMGKEAPLNGVQQWLLNVQMLEIGQEQLLTKSLVKCGVGEKMKNENYNHQQCVSAVSQLQTLVKESVPQGNKQDDGKVKMELPFMEVPAAMKGLAKVLSVGEEKYGLGNWKKVPNKERRYLAAMLRHITSHVEGELYDPETGLPHLTHAAANAMFLSDIMLTQQEALLERLGQSLS